jgi:hypothetical protein
MLNIIDRKRPSMIADNNVKFDTMSEADLEPVLELLQGGNPDVIARKAGTTKAHLFRIRDDLLAHVEQERAKATDAPPKKIGRNAPCPCGSGKKYKHCCLLKQTPAGHAEQTGKAEPPTARKAEQSRLIKGIEKAFSLLHSGRYTEAIDQASTLILRYPDEDRLHDIVATGHLYAGNFKTAIDICRHRLAVAESEKSYFIEHGRYRDSQIDQPALAYYYPPLTWLQKYWVASRSRDYQALVPLEENAAIVELVEALQTADDATRFPGNQEQGLELRRHALKATLETLKSIGPDVIPYLLPLAGRYSWAGLFVPEILSVYPTAQATRSLLDISMFGFDYASGASLHYLEKRGDRAIPDIRAAFSRDKEFDPIKTGIVSVLGNIQTPAAFELLLGLLRHESPHIVNWAGNALGKFENVEALPALEAASERIGGEQMIEAAIRRLRDLEKPTSPAAA